jgi:3-methyladenine DNA glycosylase/8-oxoguanine DNA glycosylase
MAILAKGDTEIMQALLDMVGIGRWSCLTHATRQGFDRSQMFPLGLG